MSHSENSKDEEPPHERSNLTSPPQYEEPPADPEVLPISDLDPFRKRCRYTPLSLVNPDPFNTTNQDYIMKQHEYNADEDWDIEDVGLCDIDILEDTLIGYGIYKNQPKMLMCITLFNEDPKRLVESLAGVYRAYYELLDLDPTFLNRVHVVIITDGYETLLENPQHQEVYDKANIHSIKKLNPKKYTKATMKPGLQGTEFNLQSLSFINTENMISRRIETREEKDDQEEEDEEENKEEKKENTKDDDEKQEVKIEFKDIKAYGANNIGHCFSRVMDFSEWEQALSKQQRNNFFINGYDVYDFLTGDDSVGNVKTKKYKDYPLPIHFVVKHQNQGKLESYKWFYNGFCKMMNPKYAQLIEVGAIPQWNSISRIIMHMEAFQNVGGACGEIEVKLIEKKSDGVQAVSFVESSMMRAQYVEYKVSHYMDKATESLFGFVTSLPSAFSTFRWECIKGRPISQTLKGARDDFRDVRKIMSCYTSNKYLTEDRIMAMEIVCKENENYLTHYVPGAKCLVDCPLSLTGLIKERRRIFNGWMFSSVHLLKSTCRVWKRKGSSFIRNCFLMLLYLYMAIIWILFYCMLGLFYSAFSIFVREVLPDDKCLSVTMASNLLENVYLTFLFIVLMLSTSVQVLHAEVGYRLCSFLMGLFSIVLIVCAVFYATKSDGNLLAVSLIGFFIFSFIIPLILNIKDLYISDVVKGIIYATYFLPTYANIFTIFSMANIHEVAFETVSGSLNKDKEIATKVKEAAAEKYEDYQYYRAKFLVVWLCVNFAVGGVITYLDREDLRVFPFILCCVLAGVIVFKLVVSGMHRAISWVHYCYVSCHFRKIRKGHKGGLHDEVRNRAYSESVEFEYKKCVYNNDDDEIDDEEPILIALDDIMEKMRKNFKLKNDMHQANELQKMLTISKKVREREIKKKTTMFQARTMAKANPDVISASHDHSNISKDVSAADDPFGFEEPVDGAPSFSSETSSRQESESAN
ncbi:unnamed protein product [Moneuplotes crassus]|uniref:chitin synthase n=1 Tax=Euplotes crassus TaxID=5936 RepID=A0AAD1XTD2_EUPCR|nr:unnamed protein product [Moneuplotes crassus]